MKRLLVFVFFLPIICTSQYTSIPDSIFEQALIDLGYDDVIDGQVSTSNIDAITYLYVDNRNISDLTGIEDFTALTYLNCVYNQIVSLDVSNNTALDTLICGYNQLTSLNVIQNTALTALACYENQLTSLDVSQNTALTYLNCRYNQITSINVSQNTALTYLNCGYNQLTSLDVSQNTTLNELYFYDNQLTSLDVSQNTALTELDCYDNQLTSLDVSQNTALTYLNCGYNQLTSLDVSQNTALAELYFYDNQLTSLDVSQNTALTELYFYDNQIISLDVSNNPLLERLDTEDNQLECLNLKNGNNSILTELWTEGNSNLECILADDSIYSNTNWINNPDFHLDSNQYFSPNCNYPAGCFTTSIEEYQSYLSIYPNPTNNLIQIEIENYNGSIEAALYDFTGKLLETTNKTAISLTDYPTGIYLLKVAYGDRIEEVKVVKE